MPSLVGGWIGSAIVSKVINSLVAYVIEDQPKWQGGLKAERERLNDALPQIEALLGAVEHNHFLMEENSALKEWMWQFRDAVEEAEDFVHENEYRQLEEEVKGEKSKVSSAVSGVKTFVKRALHKDSNLLELKEVVERLDKVVSVIGKFGDVIKLIETLTKDKQPLATGSYLTVETRVFGREKEKEEVINKLLNSNPTSKKNFSILPIVGVGGVGKTTLAQFVYNDERIKKHFNKRMWVCVSNNPDFILLTQKIYDESKTKTLGENPNLVNLNKLQENISDELNSQRFLLVLDDVWDDINNIGLEKLLAPLKLGKSGSMILLTTRIKRVGETMMAKLEPVFLNGLGEGEYWEFFKECAFRDEDLERYKILQDTGRKIAKKLKGSPLAAKTVGALLSTNLDDEHWKNILNSEIWKLEQNDNDFIPALKLSYQYLPSHLKPCFRFCSIFPQDYQFEKEKLVYMWMALGLLHKSKYGTARPEAIGDEYLDDLVGKSFFDCKSANYGGTYYVMHDLLHELATSVSNGECFRIDDSSEPILIPETVRHLSINTSDSLPIPGIAKLKYLRTLLLLTKLNTSYCDIPKVLKGLKSFRILDSSYFQITDDFFSNLKHLCFLRNNGGYGVPESVNKLYHLQFLSHQSDSGELSAPDYISNLINLRRLRTPNSWNGIVYGLGRLTSLQVLEELNVGEGNNVNKIVELKNLRELRGELWIKNLEDATRVEEVVEANLKAKENLRKLRLTWAGREQGRPEVDEQVLDALQPHSNLKKLEIEVYMGRTIPCWMTVSKIVSITLSHCKGIEDLSPLGQLSHLESLELYSMDSVKRVGSEAADRGIGNRVFPSLQKLRIQGLPALEEFCVGASWTTQWLPCLKELWIHECPNLRVFSNLPCGLRKLDISRVRWVALPELWVQSENNDGLEDVYWDALPELWVQSGNNDGLEDVYWDALPELWVQSGNNDGLEDVYWDALPEPWVQSGNNDGLSMPSSLSSHLSLLEIKSCPCLTSLSEGLLMHSELFTSLEKLVILDCEELTHLPIGGFSKFTSLKELKIQDCPKLRRGSTTGMFLPSSLQSLRVNDCDVLDPLPRSPEDLNFLSDLFLEGCAGITSFPSTQVLGRWKALKRLRIEDCSKLESLGGLQALTSLKYLTVEGCPKLVATASSSLSPSTGSSSLSSSLILDELMIDDPLLLGTEQLKSISAREVCLECCINVRSSALEEWALKNSTTLQELTIYTVSSQQFPLAELQTLSYLEYLAVYECRNLQGLPELPLSLINLWLDRCPPELEERCLKDSGPDWPKIQHIPDVTIGHSNKDELATRTPAKHRNRRQF